MLEGGEVTFKGGEWVVEIPEVSGLVGKGHDLLFVDGMNSKPREAFKMTGNVNVPFPYLETKVYMCSNTN